ncbi:MAG: Ppx/GppA family phosphatase, partial [Hyphomicrobiales bacterium]|nr:Ppx/GppA family phosphatase [Hyphomicrobiales bacterium]
MGSNSVRLIVYERLSRISTPLFNEKDLCGLARGMEASGRLDPAAAAAALATMRRFRALCDQIGVTRIHVLATAASREASNGKDFITAVEAIIGAPIQLLTGGEEARLTALGVISGIPGADGIAGDMGGGSLEIVDIRDGEVGSGESFALGGLRLQDAAEGAIKRAEKVISEVLSRSSVLKDGEGRDFYAIGGTWRSLARLQMRQKGYPLHVMHEYKLDAAEAADFCRMVARREVDSLDSIEVVSRNRRSLLPYGAAVLEQIIRVMKPKRIVMSALGVREGHLYDLLPDDERIRDPLIVACEELAWLRSRSPRHAGELIPWSAQAFEAVGLDETSGEVRLRHAACLLADIGWRVHPDYRGEQS